MKYFLIILIILGVAGWWFFYGGGQDKLKIDDIKKSFPTEAPSGNEEEIKEILRLTRILSDVEVRVASIQREYGIIQSISTSDGVSVRGGDQQLLSDIEDVFNKIRKDKEIIDELQRQLQTHKSSNTDVNKIKQHYVKIIDEKNLQIEELTAKLNVVQTSLLEKEKLIQEQATTIGEQTTTITKQTEIIDTQKNVINELSQKHLILYSRRETLHEEIEGKVIRLPHRERKIEIISEHEEGSYVITEESGNAVIHIVYEDRFWAENNYLIVRVKRWSL